MSIYELFQIFDDKKKHKPPQEWIRLAKCLT